MKVYERGYNDSNVDTAKFDWFFFLSSLSLLVLLLFWFFHTNKSSITFLTITRLHATMGDGVWANEEGRIIIIYDTGEKKLPKVVFDDRTLHIPHVAGRARTTILIPSVAGCVVAVFVHEILFRQNFTTKGDHHPKLIVFFFLVNSCC